MRSVVGRIGAPETLVPDYGASRAPWEESRLIRLQKLELLRALHRFVRTLEVDWRGNRRTWFEHTKSTGAVDEDILVGPRVFPEFARTFLDFTAGMNLAAEDPSKAAGTPDFSPADRLTHPFVFECKGSSEQALLVGHEQQIRRYLSIPWVKQVVLTNVVGIRVLELDANGVLVEAFAVNLRGLFVLNPEAAATLPEADRFVDFIEKFRRRELNKPQKIERVRSAPSWNVPLETTDSDWISRRVDHVVQLIRRDVDEQVRSGALSDATLVSEGDRETIVEELRKLALRLGAKEERVASSSLTEFLSASESTEFGKALIQYTSQVAYWMTTKLVLIRIWEDIGILTPASLYDGGFDRRLRSVDEVVVDVIRYSFSQGETRYKALFTQRPTLSWYDPSEDTAVDALYELANTYFGEIRSDILGQVYERTLQRIDRKLLGQYYTPRDIIELIWDLVLTDDLRQLADEEQRSLNVLDIATGSGGFLVEGLARERRRFDQSVAAGATVTGQQWMNAAAAGFCGIEIQQFSAFLAEINMLIQFSIVLSKNREARIPELGIVPADTLALHNPDDLFSDAQLVETELLTGVQSRLERARRIKSPGGPNPWFDIAIGNPPYIGEKVAAPLVRRTRELYPYWEQYVGPHLDYLYWFLITGISKLRQGGRFGFITTEYWLRSAGAAPLRRYIAEHATVERLILFRDMRLFPDAPGQHSMIVIGQRKDETDPGASPIVSMYEGGPVPIVQRRAILDVFRTGIFRRSLDVNTFRSQVLPNQLGSSSWGEAIMSKQALARRRALQSRPQLGTMMVTKGIETTVHFLPADADEIIPGPVLTRLGWPGHRVGLQLLSAAEVDRLGPLSDAERFHVRPHLNTADVLPYAAVLPNSPDSILYFARPADAAGVGRDAARALPFPAGLPRLEGYLHQFKPLLEAKVRQRNESRPWWTLHRPRAELVERHGGGTRWADFCVTTRWGGGNQLVVGLCPAGAVPASGLHALYLDDFGHAAYLTGLLNSSLYQELADTFSPGQIRAEELESLGVPDLGTAARSAIAEITQRQANLVADAVVALGERFPRLKDVLRNSPNLDDLPDEAWLPAVGNPTAWGTAESVSWLRSATHRGAQNGVLHSVHTEDTLLGRHIIAISQSGNSEAQLLFETGDTVTDTHLDVIVAYLNGAASRGIRLREISNLPMPVDVQTLATLHSNDLGTLNEFATSYRESRAEIDGYIGSAAS